MSEAKSRIPSISIRGLRKAFGDMVVLDDLNLDVQRGEFFGLIGHNGAGKSTTIDILVGLKPMDEGDVLVNGFSIKSDPERAKATFGYVSSEPVAYEDMSGLSFVRFIASIYSVEPDDFSQRVEFLSKRLNLSREDLSRPVREYSHGMKQKICLIASLIHAPSLWVLDEPTVGLDIFTAEELAEMMTDYVKGVNGVGNTIFMASHNIELVSTRCDRVGIIQRGKLVRIFDLREGEQARRACVDYFERECRD